MKRMQFGQPNRREVTTSGGAAAAWPQGRARSIRPDQIRGRNLYGIGDDIGRCATSASRRRWSRSNSRSKLQFIVRKAVWTDAILGEP